MKEEFKKLFFISGAIIIIGVAFIFVRQSFSYDTYVAHPLFAEKSAALYNQGANNKLSYLETDWIRQGAVDEDTPHRWMNHFYDPTTGFGLPGFAPANVWVNSGLAQSTYLMGDQTWQTAITAYNNGDKKRAFLALGHILHLIEDITVPAHTRIDMHPEGDPYEEWVKANTDKKYNQVLLIKLDNLNQSFNSLATYSNKYFFSKDTIDKDNLNKLKTELILDNSKILSCFISYDENKNRYCLVAGDINFVNPSKSIYRLIDRNHSDYYSLLASKAISYGAGVIDLFFRQAEIEKNKKLTTVDKLKKTFSSLSGVLISSFSNFFGTYQTAVTDYSNKLSAGSTANGGKTQTLGQVLSAFEQAGSAEEIFKPQPAGAEDTSAAKANPPNPSASSADRPYQGGETRAGERQPPSPPLSGGQAPVRQNPLNPPLPGGQSSGGQVNLPNSALPGGKEIPLTPFVKGGNVVSTFILVAGDGTPPETVITSVPGQITSFNSANFTFTANEANSTFECNLNDVGWQGCSSPRNLSNLTDGNYVFKVRARDSSNNVDQTPAQHSWTVDMTAPQITITNNPADFASSTAASFTFNSNESNATFECDLDNVDWAACLSPKDYSALVEGAHNFKIRAHDQAGNISATTTEFSWTIDTTLPQVIIQSGPPAIASSTAANFQFNSSENDTAYQCQIDINPWEPCAASATAASLIEGQHSLEVKGLDQAGNTSSSTIKTWLVDLTAPASTVASLVATYAATGFTISWSGIDADATGATATASGLAGFTVQYKIESGDWQGWINATTSTSTIFSLAVANGQTVYFRSRALDLAGNLENWPAETNGDTNTTIIMAADHLVISEIQVGGSVADDEFIELYNPTNSAINLQTLPLALHIRNSVGTDNAKILTFNRSVIPAKGYFLLTSATSYTGAALPDATYSTAGGSIKLAANGGAYISTSTTVGLGIIDRVGWGSQPSGGYETQSYPVSPPAGQSLERKAAATSTAQTMAAGGAHQWQGNGYDSNNNSADFILRTSAEPQNSNSLVEPRDNTPDSTAPASTVASLEATYQAIGFTVSWSGEDFDDVGATTTASGLASFDLQYRIGGDGWLDWVGATTSTSTVFNIAVANGQTVYFRSRARDLAGNLENWPAGENGDTGTTVLSNQNKITAGNTSYALSNWQSSFSWKHTVAGADPVLLVSLHGDGDYLNAGSVTYDGQTMILAAKKIYSQAFNNIAVYVYYLVNPPSGQHDLAVNIGWFFPFAASAITFINCDTANPLALAETFLDTAAPITHSVTTAKAKMMLVDAVTYNKSVVVSVAVGAGQTQYFNQETNGQWFGQTNDLYAGESYKLAGLAGGQTMSWQTGDGHTSVQVIVALNPKP